MTLHVEISDSLALRVAELAERTRVPMNSIVSAALTAQVDAAPMRPSIKERAALVNWADVDAIMARVPDVAPELGDELP